LFGGVESPFEIYGSTLDALVRRDDRDVTKMFLSLGNGERGGARDLDGLNASEGAVHVHVEDGGDQVAEQLHDVGHNVEEEARDGEEVVHGSASGNNGGSKELGNGYDQRKGRSEMKRRGKGGKKRRAY